MKALVDTHVLLWFLTGDPALGDAAKAVMEDEATDLLLSVASLWEIAIKISIGKLEVPGDYEAFFTRQLAMNDIALLPISLRHTAAVCTLPFHHRDPFDRLLIAQAQVEGIPILSHDAAFDAYGVERIR